MKRANLKIMWIFSIVVLIGCILIFNVSYITLFGHHLRSNTDIIGMMDGNLDGEQVIQAKRGNIRDRNGSIIASDQETYIIKAVLYEGRSGDYAYVKDKEFTAKALAPYLNMSEEEIMSYLDLQQQGVYETLFGEKGKNLSIETKEAIEAIEYTPDPEKKTPGLPGIEFEKTTSRVYTPNKFASNLLGFANYSETEHRIVGQLGIEAYLDEQLKGEDGLLVYQKDAIGYSLPGTEKIEKNAVNGNDVYLTINKEVQSALESALQSTLDENSATLAWGVVMEVKTGKILAYGGYPTFDLNKRDIESYLDIPSMYNFEPGSVMKPFTYAAAIDSGVYKAEDTVYTGRYCIGYDANGQIYRQGGPCSEFGNINDANRDGWGTISFDEGLIRSSNTCIATLLVDYLNQDVFVDYLNKLGFFKPVGVEGMTNYEEAGWLNDGAEQDILSTGFGQSSAVTTLQLMQAYTALFNDGNMVKPYYIDKIVNPNTNEVVYQGKTRYVYSDAEGNSIPVFKQSTIDKIQSLMVEVINNDEIGTGTKYRVDGINMMGKTGTGEIAIDGRYGEMFTSSIMAAAPYEDPEIMMYYAFISPYTIGYNADFFKNVFTVAYNTMNLGKPSTQIETADTSYEQWQSYEMPTLKNHTMQYVNWKLDEMDINRVIIGDGATAIDQYPTMGQIAHSKQNVFIKSDGTNYTMPNMMGWTLKDVQIYAQLLGIPITIEGRGCVAEQNIEPDNAIYPDSEIIVRLE